MKRNRIPFLASVILLALLIAGCSTLIPGLNPAPSNAGNTQTASARPTYAQEGSLAPEINLKSLTGDQITLSKLEGRPVLVNFWATWCGPCREEFPALQRAYKKYQDKGFIIVGVNYQDENSDQGVLTFVRNSVVTFPIVRDTGERLGRMYNVRGLPTSFLMDKTGVIRSIVVGSVVGFPREDNFFEDELAKIF